MKYELSQTFYFDAAHTLRRQIETKGSRRIHGHTYHAEITLAGVPDPTTGMVIDLGEVRREIQLLRDQLDHHFLDEVPGLGPATLENLASFIFQKISQVFPQLVQVTVLRRSMGDRCSIRRD
jgi:6-pyruvoyltetrahydropterin/6-carboxytetrahydropterin synthase